MSPPHLRLVALKVSPWSERAKWVLDHHGLTFETIEHTPFLGERRLRRIAGNANGRATVPVLLTGQHALTQSWDIALYADREGKGSKLVPQEIEGAIREWSDLADETMNAGRTLVVAGLLASPAALDEAAPPFAPAWMRPIFRPMVRHGTEWFARKYGLRFEDAPAKEAQMRSTLERLRAALAKSTPYLLGAFSYADIVMAGCLQGISPVADRHMPIGPATRKVWTHEKLAAEFADLIAWRDDLYERLRGAPPVAG